MYLTDLICDFKTVKKLQKSYQRQKEEHALQYDLTKLRLRPMGDMDGEQLCVFIQVFQKYEKGLYLGFVRNNEYVYGVNMIRDLDKDITDSDFHYAITYIGGTVQRYGSLIRRCDNHKTLYEEDWEKAHPGVDGKLNDEYSATIHGIVEDYYNQLENPIPYKLLTADRVGTDLFYCFDYSNEEATINKDRFKEIMEQVKIDNLDTDHHSSIYKALLKEIERFMTGNFSKVEIIKTLKYLK